jgi:aspartate/glutamate racemase
MKKIGIVGGISWRPTVEYFREICRCAQERHLAQGLRGTAPMPEIVIESLNLAKSMSLLAAMPMRAPGAGLTNIIERLCSVWRRAEPRLQS